MHGFRTSLIVTSAVCCVAHAQPAHAQQRSFNVPAQEISRAIPELARQAGIQIVAPADGLENIRSGAVRGTMDLRVALRRMLEGTGLIIASDQGGVILLRRGEARSRPSQIRAPIDANARPQHARSRVTPPRPLSPQGADTSNASVESAEIVVTATRRPERLLDAPISVAALRGSDLDRRGASGSSDYLRGVPGVSQSEGIFGQSVVIRGIETSPHLQNFFTGTTTATYFGESPTTNTAGLGGGSSVDIKAVDIDRVEVLRGPQGTSFGDSSLGGAVRTIPTAPRLDRLEGRISGGMSLTARNGDYNYNGQAVLNVPVVRDILAVRAVAYRYYDSGYYDNFAATSAAFQSGVVVPFGASGFAFDDRNVGTTRVDGIRLSALLQPTANFKLSLNYLWQRNEMDGVGVATRASYQQTILAVAPEHVVRGERSGVFDADVKILNAVAEYKLPWADLLATYTHTNSGSVQSYPFGAVGINVPVSSLADSHHREDVGEFRFVTRFDGPLNFIAGAFVEDLRDTADFDNVWHGAPAANIFGTTRDLGIRFDNRNLKQTAAFGEVTWEIVPRLKLTGGVRTYRYNRRFEVNASGPLYSPTIALRDTARATGQNYRANISYRLQGGGVVYAGFSQGFRLGQPQVGLPAATCDTNNDGLVDGTSITIASTRRVDSDSINNYEVGSRVALADRRITLSADAYRMDWRNMPVQLRPGSGGCLLGFVANAGRARSEGIEAQTNIRLSDNLRVDLGGAYTNARLTTAVPAANAPVGNRLVGAPRWNGNVGVEFAFPMGGRRVSLRSDAIYVGPFFSDLANTQRLKSGDYVLLNASARVDFGAVTLDLFVRNLTNEDAYTYRGIRPSVGAFYGYQLRPRTIGFQLGYSF